MKKLIFLFLVIVSHPSFAQVFLKEKPANEKAAVSFTEPTLSVAFFGKDDGSSAFKKHQLKGKEINAYFGAVYDNFPIFGIGDANLIEYKNSEGSFYFYRLNTRKAFGMVLSNGKEQPVVVYNPDQYLKTIKTYLNIGNADYLVPKTFNAKNERNMQEEVARISKSTFVPNQAYAQQVISNSGTVHYMRPYKNNGPQLKCATRIYEIFADSLMTKKMPYGAVYLYNDKNELLQMDNLTDGKSSGFSKYVRNKYGLIDLLITGSSASADTTRFIYEADRFHTINSSRGIPYSYETFFLNDYKQCVRRLSKRADQSIVWDIYYIYDHLGRLVRESRADSEMLYKYNSDSDELFSSFSSYNLNPRQLMLDNEVIRMPDKQIFIGKDGNQQQTFKSITYTEKDGSTKTYAYDKDNKLTSVSVFRCGG